MIKKIYNKSVENRKGNLVIDYLRLMLVVFFLYILLYKFYIKDDFIVIYSITGFVLTGISYFIVSKIKELDNYIRAYLVLAPFCISILLFTFWKYTIVTMIWYIPVPLGAYILFGKKHVYFYTCYIIFLVATVAVCASVFSYEGRAYSRNEILISDILAFTINLFLIVLLLYHREKIRDVETLSILELLNAKSHERKTTKTPDLLMLASLFKDIENEVKNKELYRDPNFTLSKLASALNVNPIYISKAINYRDYNNFNHYINTLRITYVKDMLSKTDLQKVTMLYIYSEAGFSNQSTFNRVFKQIERLSPTEYINLNNLKVD